MSFEDQLEFGRCGEKVVAEWLKRRGHYVIPTYDYSGSSGGAPHLDGLRDRVVVPDLDVSKDGCRTWVEVKRYSQPAFYRKTGKWRHGITTRLKGQYLQVQEITGCVVLLVILEDWQSGDAYRGDEKPAPAMLSGRIDALPWDSCVCDNCRAGMSARHCRGNGLVYCDRDAFDIIDRAVPI